MPGDKRCQCEHHPRYTLTCDLHTPLPAGAGRERGLAASLRLSGMDADKAAELARQVVEAVPRPEAPK